MIMATNVRNDNNNITIGIYECWSEKKERKYELENKLPANAAVLFKNNTLWHDGKRYKIVRFLAVEGVKNTKLTSVLKPVLIAMLAEARTRSLFANEYQIITQGNRTIETTLNVKSSFSEWLNSTKIGKTNTKGELNIFFETQDSKKLFQTLPTIKMSDKELLDATDDLLRELIYERSIAIKGLFDMKLNT